MIGKTSPIYFSILLIVLLWSCTSQDDGTTIPPVNWSERVAQLPDSLEQGETYLSVYSQIYSEKEHRTHDLTVTVSIRNTDHDQRIYLNEAVMYDTHGELLKSYVKETSVH